MIGKLRGRSVAELRDRLVQFAWNVPGRLGVRPRAAAPRGIALEPVTPWPLVDASAIRSRMSDAGTAHLIARAERIVGGTFDVLGFEGLSYGSPVDWQHDPVSRRSAALVHHSRVPYLDSERVGDHKITWEVNRHQWFMMLGQAWILTGDDRYATTAERLLRDWLHANPPKDGINWCSSLELAFRVQSWIHGLRLFAAAPAFTDACRALLVGSASLHTLHIERNLSTWFSPNTHLTGEALALLAVGTAWPALPQASRWRDLGWSILVEQLPKQVRSDGVYFEQSAWYQSYTVDFYLIGMAYAAHNGLPVSRDCVERVRLAARALRAVTRPDGTIVRLSDDDGGRALPLTASPFGDMTDSLWRAAVALDDDTVIPGAGSGRSALLWLEGATVFDRMSAKRPADAGRASVALRDGGWMVMTETGRTAAADHWLVFDAGPHGSRPHAHSHADALAIDVSVHGVPLLVDPGTSAYVGNARRTFRSTAAHNTVTVDGRDSSEQGAAFKWNHAANTSAIGFAVSPHACWASASHDGYNRLPDPVGHRRDILRLARHYWIVYDSITASAGHTLALTFQAADGTHVDRESSHAFVVNAGAVGLRIVLDPRLHGELESRMVSPAYGLERPATAIVAGAQIAGTTTLCTVFGATDEIEPLQLERDDARSMWRIRHPGGEDVVARPAGLAMTLGPAQFDGAVFAMVNRGADAMLVAAGEGTLHFDGRAIPLGADDLRVAHRASDGTWAMES